MISVIETHDLCKSYNGRIVVEHLNLSVPQGCVYGFLWSERCRKINKYENPAWSGTSDQRQCKTARADDE